jgi:hypothetical protein
MTLGTIAYMSKEQLLGKPLDGRSDLYSLGVTLYECLTGRLPFEDDDERKLVLKIAKSEPIPPREHHAAISPELERVVLKAIAKEPDDRYQTAAELEGALLALGSRSAVEATATAIPAGAIAPRAPAPTAAPMPSARAASASVVVGLVLLGVGLIVGLPVVVATSGTAQGVGLVLVGLGLLGGLLIAASALHAPRPARATCPTCDRALLVGMTSCPFCQPPRV